eukprot:11954768-Alexandrium_andersonii.AAC.1
MANIQHHLPRAGKFLRDIKKVVLTTDYSGYGTPEISMGMILEADRARGLVSIPGEFDYALW